MSYPTPATTVEARIMKVLSEGEAYGAQIARQSDGLIKSGTVYGALKRLEGMCWVESRLEVVVPSGSGRRRKMYSLTEFGEDALFSYVHLIKRTRKAFEKNIASEFASEFDLEWFNNTEMAKGF